MDDQIIVRIQKEVKQEFVELAKRNSTDASTLIRNYVKTYNKENRVSFEEEMGTMWQLGHTLQQAMSVSQVFEYAKELQNTPDVEIVSRVMELLVMFKVRSPKILLELEKNASLKSALLAGMMAEEGVVEDEI